MQIYCVAFFKPWPWSIFEKNRTLSSASDLLGDQNFFIQWRRCSKIYNLIDNFNTKNYPALEVKKTVRLSLREQTLSGIGRVLFCLFVLHPLNTIKNKLSIELSNWKMSARFYWLPRQNGGNTSISASAEKYWFPGTSWVICHEIFDCTWQPRCMPMRWLILTETTKPGISTPILIIEYMKIWFQIQTLIVLALKACRILFLRDLAFQAPDFI